MEEKIRGLFATMLQMEPGDISDATRPGNLDKWDSMQHLIMVSAFEEEFAFEVEPEDAVEMYEDFATFKRIVLQKMEHA
jgi:acyl carrier protein